MDPVSIVFNSSFWYTSSWYTLWLVNCVSLLQHLCQSLGFARAESNKHVKQVKLSYTTPFDVLTRETVFSGLPRVTGCYWGIWKRCLRALPFLFPPFFARSLFLCSLAFFTRPLGRQRKEDGKPYGTNSRSFCKIPEHSNIKWRSRQKHARNSPVTFVTRKRFSFVVFLPFCCVSLLLVCETTGSWPACYPAKTVCIAVLMALMHRFFNNFATI